MREFGWILTGLLVVLSTSAAHAQFQWQLLPASPTGPGRHDDAFFVSPLLGWIVNGTGEVHRTTNGGETWTMQTDRNVYFRSVGFADSVNGWIGVLDPPPAMLHTTNGGLLWKDVTQIPLPLPAGICGISVVNRDVVYASGKYSGPAAVIKTTDGGASWKKIALDSVASALVDCYFFSPDSGFVVGAAGGMLHDGMARILFTTNGGDTWTPVFTGTRTGELCWKIIFPSHNVGYVSIERFLQGATYILKTTDRGQTWTEKQFSTTLIDQQGIGFVNDTHGWVGGWNNPTYETTNGGDTWIQAPFGVNVNRFRFLGDTLGYAVGQRVYKYARTTVDVPQDATPARFALYQNYPNPFNPKTEIGFQIAEGGFVSLKVFDVLGREVATLVDEPKPAGNHRIDLDASGFSSGVYLYKLTAGRFTAVRKMMVIK